MLLTKIQRDTLLAPLQSVSGIVEKRHTLPILSNVLLEKQEIRFVVFRFTRGWLLKCVNSCFGISENGRQIRIIFKSFAGGVRGGADEFDFLFFQQVGDNGVIAQHKYFFII